MRYGYVIGRRPVPLWRRVVAALAVLCLLLGLAGPLLARAQGGAPGPHILSMEVDGVINGVKVRYIQRALTQAQEDGAALLVMRLDTPGGLLEATREIVELLLAAPRPVAVYVHPSGARAGSAGTFITAAANLAVMAPGSNIGAATPVSGTGEDLGETLASKVENDAAALMRSIAQERGRNAAPLEATVRQAASYSAREALQLNIIDFIAEDLESLLRQADGRTAQTAAGETVLQTRGLPVRTIGQNALELFLEFLADPNVSFLLLTIGGLGIVIELLNPGLIVPVVVGAICLLLAFLSIGNLPVNWAGVAFILLAAVLAGGEVLVAGFGVLGVGAIVCLVVGGFLLFAQFGGGSPTLPPISVNPWLIGGVGLAAGGGMYYVITQAVRSRRRGAGRVGDTAMQLVGQSGVVTQPLTPRGVVRVANETWTAVSDDGTMLERGTAVSVVAADGLVLTVARQPLTDGP